jgi:hypothetical protein
LRDARVVRAANELADAIERAAGAAAALVLRRLGPFVDEREGEAEIRGDLLRAGFLQDPLMTSCECMAAQRAAASGKRNPAQRADSGDFWPTDAPFFGVRP